MTTNFLRCLPATRALMWRRAWTHLLIGVVVAAAGFAVLAGQVWGRSVGVGVAVLSMLANFAFVPYYPVWSLLIIALDFFVIWALIAYRHDSSRV